MGGGATQQTPPPKNSELNLIKNPLPLAARNEKRRRPRPRRTLTCNLL